MVKILIQTAAVLSIDLNAKRTNGKTASYLACQGGSSDVVKIFMENSTFLSIDLNTMAEMDCLLFVFSVSILKDWLRS